MSSIHDIARNGQDDHQQLSFQRHKLIASTDEFQLLEEEGTCQDEAEPTEVIPPQQ